MTKYLRTLFLSLIFISLISSCSMRTRRSAAVTGGITGGVTGAGVGALTGLLLTNGDVAGSALLGAGIGIPVGIASGLAYKYYVYDKPVRDNNELIEERYHLIEKRKEEITTTREQMLNESYLIVPDENLRMDMYLSPTIGVNW